MKIVETTILENSIRMRLADQFDPTKATEWIELLVPMTALRHPRDEKRPLGDPDTQMVAEVREAALRYARQTIVDETQRLALLERHSL